MFGGFAAGEECGAGAPTACDRGGARVHGGADKAVYAYPHQYYSFWEAELWRRPLPFGQFGVFHSGFERVRDRRSCY